MGCVWRHTSCCHSSTAVCEAPLPLLVLQGGWSFPAISCGNQRVCLCSHAGFALLLLPHGKLLPIICCSKQRGCLRSMCCCSCSAASQGSMQGCLHSVFDWIAENLVVFSRCRLWAPAHRMLCEKRYMGQQYFCCLTPSLWRSSRGSASTLQLQGTFPRAVWLQTQLTLNDLPLPIPD